MKNIVIFGAPGSGKGTQSDKMIAQYGFEHISTGDVLRNEIKNGTELGKTAKSYIDQGQLIPDELMIDILASVYDSFGKEHKGVIFDGFPRTIPQAEALKKMLAERGHKVAAMIELDVPEDVSYSADSRADAAMTTKRLSRSASTFITTRHLPSLNGTPKKAYTITSTVWVSSTASLATSLPSSTICNIIKG